MCKECAESVHCVEIVLIMCIYATFRAENSLPPSDSIVYSIANSILSLHFLSLGTVIVLIRCGILVRTLMRQRIC